MAEDELNKRSLLRQALAGGLNSWQRPEAFDLGARMREQDRMRERGDQTRNRGIRNNNWLNIRYNPANNWVGQTGEDAAGFVVFRTPEHSIRAADIILKNYKKKHGIDTVYDAISRFSPPKDNNPTSSYARHVASAIGVNPFEEINLGDPNVRESLIKSMLSFETPQAESLYTRALMDQARSLGNR